MKTVRHWGAGEPTVSAKAPIIMAVLPTRLRPPQGLRRRCSGRGVADTVFSHVPGEGIAAVPGGRGVITVVCVPSLPWLSEFDSVRGM